MIKTQTHLKGVEDRRKVLVELDVYDGTDNLGYAPHAASVHSGRGMEARAACNKGMIRRARSKQRI